VGIDILSIFCKQERPNQYIPKNSEQLIQMVHQENRFSKPANWSTRIDLAGMDGRDVTAETGDGVCTFRKPE
jgi:hypothetical protein